MVTELVHYRGVLTITKVFSTHKEKINNFLPYQLSEVAKAILYTFRLIELLQMENETNTKLTRNESL